MKLCLIWSAEGRDENGTPVRDLGSITYSAAIESAAIQPGAHLSEFGERVDREATRRRFNDAPRQVVLGDGAAWIWNIADTQFPGAIQIVDRYHVKEHLATIGKAIWGPESKLGERWIEERCQELDDGRLDDIILALRSHVDTTDEARRGIHYIEANKHRLDYPAFRAAGLCTSSGVVEAGCKVIVGDRLKKVGMHWTAHGADAIAALRCCRLSGQFEAFWERRAALREAA